MMDLIAERTKTLYTLFEQGRKSTFTEQFVFRKRFKISSLFCLDCTVMSYATSVMKVVAGGDDDYEGMG